MNMRPAVVTLLALAALAATAAAGPAELPKAGLLAVYDPAQHDGTSTQWDDLSGNGNHATFVGLNAGLTTSTGELYFDGTRSVYARTPFTRGQLAALPSGGRFSYVARVKYEVNALAHPSHQAVFGGYNPGNTRVFFGKPYVGFAKVGLQDGDYNPNMADSNNLYNEEWHTLIGVHEGGGAWKIYVDGVFAGGSTVALNGAAGEVILVGHEDENTGYTWTGSMSGAAIYGVALDAAGALAAHEALTVDCSVEGLPSPTLDAAASTISGTNLELRLGSDADRYVEPVAFAFVGAEDAAACNTAAGVGPDGADVTDGAWLHQEVACNDRHTFSMNLPDALDKCGFAGPATDPVSGRFYFESTVQATTKEAGTPVFGTATTRTDVTTVAVRVEYPASAEAVTSGEEVFGERVLEATATAQRAETVTGEFEFDLGTVVQAPYELAETGAVAVSSPAFTARALAVTPGSGGDCSGQGGNCQQTFTLTGKTAASECSVDTEVTVSFTVQCRDTSDSSCDTPSNPAASATFRVRTANLCADVVEVAEVVPSLKVYAGATDRENEANDVVDFVERQSLFGRVQLKIEGAVDVTQVDLTDLTIHSECAGACTQDVKPLANEGAAASAYAWAHRSFANEPRHDFEFDLISGASMSYDAGGTTGNVEVTVTAVVAVQYTNAASQTKRRLFRVQAAAATAQAQASTTFGTSSSAAGSPSSASSSGSVSAMAVAAALAAVVALAVVGAVAVSRRRSSARRQRAQKSSSAASLQLDAVVSTAPAAAADTTMPVDDLRSVQGAYSTTA